MCKALLTILMLLTASLTASAEVLSDPMRPHRTPTVARSAKQPQFFLTAILYSPERRVAIINGQAVAEGGRVAGARVRHIYRDSLELETGGKLLTLSLGNTGRKPADRSLK